MTLEISNTHVEERRKINFRTQNSHFVTERLQQLQVDSSPEISRRKADMEKEIGKQVEENFSRRNVRTVFKVFGLGNLF